MSREISVKTLFLLCVILNAGAAFASLEADSDATATDAAILLREGKPDEALRILNQGLSANPKSVELQEVKALVLVAKKDEAGASQILEKLKGQSGLSQKRLGGYQYQLGLMQFQRKNMAAAKKSFNYALSKKFNEAGSRYYLGVVELEEKNYSAARDNLLAVLQTDVKEFHPPARLYLAQLASQLNDGGSALRFYGRAREEARDMTTDMTISEGTRKLARQVMLNAERDLRAYEENLFFANVGLFAGYDSNILLLPSAALSGAGGTGSPSGVGTFRYGLGYATTPMSDWQLVGSYYGNANLNSSAITQSAEFFNHDLAVYLTRNPLKATNYGMKLQGIGILQYQKDPATSNSKFALYSVQGSFGPYYRTQLTPGWYIGAEALFQPQKFHLDQYQPLTNKRSGWDALGRVYVARESVGGSWNPSASLALDYNNTSGEEFRSKRLALDLSNTVYLSPDFITSYGATIALLSFTDRPAGTRSDQFMGVTGNLGYRLMPEMMVLANLQLQSNFTNTASYRYSRIVGNVGATYAF